MRGRHRRFRTLGANVVALVLGRGLRGWGRNLLTIAPAMGSMTILLTICGAAGVAAIAATATLAEQSAQAFVLHVYLADQATPAQVDELRASLNADPRVRSVTVVSSGETLRRELQRPGVSGLVAAAGGNPFPASLDVTLASASSMPAVAASVRGSAAVDPLFPTSYDAATYARLKTLVARLTGVGAAACILLTLVSVAVTANGIRAAVVARSAEVRIMRLVGAPWWAVRMPFLVEGGVTGATAGAVAGGIVVAAVVALSQASSSLFTSLLPGVSWPRVVLLSLGLVVAGTLLGASSGALAMRRLPS